MFAVFPEIEEKIIEDNTMIVNCMLTKISIREVRVDNNYFVFVKTQAYYELYDSAEISGIVRFCTLLH